MQWNVHLFTQVCHASHRLIDEWIIPVLISFCLVIYCANEQIDELM